MKTNTNITYKEFKETDIYKSAAIIEFINEKGGSSFDDISDETLESMIVKDYNYESGYLEIVLREEENKMKTMLYNAIILLFDENINEYNGLDDEEFIDKICSEVGMTKIEYKNLMLINNI